MRVRASSSTAFLAQLCLRVHDRASSRSPTTARRDTIAPAAPSPRTSFLVRPGPTAAQHPCSPPRNAPSARKACLAPGAPPLSFHRLSYALLGTIVRPVPLHLTPFRVRPEPTLRPAGLRVVECLACLTILRLTSVDECTACPEGSFCTGGKAAPSGACFPGYYCPEGTRKANQFPCAPGTFNPSYSIVREEQCFVCPQGHFCEKATFEPEACPAGTFMSSGLINAVSPAEALTCADNCGEFFLVRDSSEYLSCVSACYNNPSCVTGCFEDIPSFDTCRVACLNNTEGSAAQMISQCTPCTAGYFCHSGEIDPRPCPAGFFSDTSAAECTPCLVGHFCNDSATSYSHMWSNLKCPGGMFCEAGLHSLDDADECLAGHYCPEATPRQINCPVGTFNPDTRAAGIESCRPCTAGYYCLEASSAVSGICAAGFYCPTEFQSTEVTNGVTNLTIGSYGPRQEPCPGGTYRDTPGGRVLADCLTCPSGYVCNSDSSSAVECPRGFYCPLGSADAVPCPLGSFGAQAMLTALEECTLCTGGFYCDALGAWSPTGPCDPGYVCYLGAYTSNPRDGVTGEECPPGGYCTSGSALSSPCPAGTFNNVTGSSTEQDCEQCTPGYYCSNTRNPGPSGPCDAGYYCEGGAYEPKQNVCPAGHFAPMASSAPVPCPRGTYQPAEGMYVMCSLQWLNHFLQRKRHA